MDIINVPSVRLSFPTAHVLRTLPIENIFSIDMTVLLNLARATPTSRVREHANDSGARALHDNWLCYTWARVSLTSLMVGKCIWFAAAVRDERSVSRTLKRTERTETSATPSKWLGREIFVGSGKMRG